MGDVDRAGDCVRDHYVLRAGALDVLVESARLDGDGVELELLERAMCQRAAPEFFASCTSDYVESTCADPTTWLVECSPVDLDACPFAAP